ncbi:hypothetical protein MLD38_018126 [Melastoma candidum]|uniref:Uncharacterized protein n=1 Tax=Melastoma candidum TaxID=119954 RepID=A0ACB9R139_9MYRT|nr:hypothetical protein MLD38_018126 [Melastoma candidum]
MQPLDELARVNNSWDVGPLRLQHARHISVAGVLLPLLLHRRVVSSSSLPSPSPFPGSGSARLLQASSSALPTDGNRLGPRGGSNRCPSMVPFVRNSCAMYPARIRLSIAGLSGGFLPLAWAAAVGHRMVASA